MPDCGEVAHDVEHVADQLGVERTGRLVEEHQLRLHRQRPRDRDPLLLAAGELPRVGSPPGPRVRPARAARAPARSAPSRGTPFTRQRRLDDVAEHRHVREQVEVLEDHADIGALPGDLPLPQLVELVAALLVADELAVDLEPAGVDLLEMVDAAQQRGLARSGRADDAHDLAALHLEVDAFEHLVDAEALADPFGLDHRGRTELIGDPAVVPGRRESRQADGRNGSRGSTAQEGWRQAPRALSRARSSARCRTARVVRTDVIARYQMLAISNSGIVM